jgi:tetratricopeptide (TPR) repeat protein
LSFNKTYLTVVALFFGLSMTGQTANVFSAKGRGTRGPAILSLEPGARNAGVAGAFAATAEDGDALFGNPAGLQQLSNKEFRFSGGDLIADQTQTSVSYAHPLWRRGERETWGAYVHGLAMTSFDVYENGEPIGAAHPQDWVAALAYAGPTFFGNWGLAVKGVTTETFESKGKTVAADFGLQGGGARWGWGAGVANLGPSFQLGSEQVSLPTRLRAGVNQRWLSSRGDVSAALLGDLPSDGDPAAALGLELETKWGSLWRTAIRGGVRTSGNPFALGAGVTRGALSIQYAYTPTANDGPTGQLDVIYRFGHEPPQETHRRELTQEARALMDSGNYGKAQSVLDEVFLFSPRSRRARTLERELRLRVAETLDPDTLFDLGRRNATAGNDEKAADYFRKLLIVQPDHKGGKMALAQVESRLAEQQAARLRQEVARARALDRARWAKDGRALEAKKKWEDALIVWLKINQNAGEGTSGIERCRAALYQEAEKAQASNDFDRARALFIASDRSGPYRDAGTRARTMEKQSMDLRAARALEKYRLGQEAYLKGDLNAAQELFQAATILDPTNRDAEQALNHLKEERRLSHQR